MVFTLEPYPPGSSPILEEIDGQQWTPLFQHSCSFPPEIFSQVMLNLIRNPNINSNHLFRADISLECTFTDGFTNDSTITPRIVQFEGLNLQRVIVRTMIPRNLLVDKPLDQTCLIYEQFGDSTDLRSLVIYLPHVSSSDEMPFYHPAVRGIAFTHSFRPSTQQGTISISYSFFASEPRSVVLERTAQHLLHITHKHGQGTAAGYVKKVHHDIILPQATVQNTYARLKAKYARALISSWVEVTDPGKHVFEDLGIAAFLIELWADMYKESEFPGFVDIGCGNGLLVHILLEEGYVGWGFDARRRKSWGTYSSMAQRNLKELVLIPSILQRNEATGNTHMSKPEQYSAESTTPILASTTLAMDKDESVNPIRFLDNHNKHKSSDSTNMVDKKIGIHDGTFPKGTFIISNHADELTAWTPILANLSESPFMIIPCCSHSLTGKRFRAPPPKDACASNSAYSSLVAWLSKLAKTCGWEIEKEMLRIPSTRNAALIGRNRTLAFEDVDINMLISANGGADGWEQNALKLVNGATRSH